MILPVFGDSRRDEWHYMGSIKRIFVSLQEVDLSTAVDNARSVSGVAADPIGRGFGVATVIPSANNTVLGRE